MNRRRFTCLLALIGGTLALSPTASAKATYSFKPLAMVPTYYRYGQIPRSLGLSPDGVFVAGEHQSQAAFEKGGSIQTLGMLPGAGYSQATGITANGDTAIGWTDLGISFYWTSQTGMISLGTLPNQQYSLATDISAAGDAVIGYSGTNGIWEAFIWSPSIGMKGLGFLPGCNNSIGAAISENGKVATGYSWGIGGWSTILACRWDSRRIQNLGTLPGYTNSFGYGISRYGDYIVGTVSGPHFLLEGFIWDKSSGMRGIGHIRGYLNSQLWDVSEKGDRSVGSVDNYPNFPIEGNAILYSSQAKKAILIKDLLLAKGVTSVTGWQLEEATSISDDGTVIVGSGVDPLGRRMYWQATLP
jgi:uncharacterized membrane protein